MPDDWDMFVGIMWSRFGTPTGRSGSGTQEEFERAIARHRTAPGSVSVLFYFKDEPLAPSKIDGSQLQQVQAFKQSTQSSGLLTWDFTDADQFERLVELHITKHVQDWRSTATSSKAASTPRYVTSVSDRESESSASPEIARLGTQEEDDAGYLDLLEAFSQQSSEIEQIASRLTAAQNALTEKTTEGHKRLEQLKADPENLSTRRFREVVAKVADEMLTFTSCVEAEVPKFGAAVDSTVSTLTRLAAVSAELYPQQVSDTKSAVFSLLQSLAAARQSAQEFKDTTSALPRMTKELNVAKRKQSAALGSLVGQFENGERLLTEALTVISGLSERQTLA
jgi:hypothetical protein